MHQLGQRGDVVYVLQAFAHRFQNDREVRVLARDVQQLRCPLPLVPQRRPFAGVPAGQKQCAGGTFAEPRREQRRAADLCGDDGLDLVGVEHEQIGAGRSVLGVG